MNQAAEPVKIAAHVFRIDDQLVDHVGKSREREIEMDRRVRRDAALDG